MSAHHTDLTLPWRAVEQNRQYLRAREHTWKQHGSARVLHQGDRVVSEVLSVPGWSLGCRRKLFGLVACWVGGVE